MYPGGHLGRSGPETELLPMNFTYFINNDPVVNIVVGQQTFVWTEEVVEQTTTETTSETTGLTSTIPTSTASTEISTEISSTGILTETGSSTETDITSSPIEKELNQGISQISILILTFVAIGIAVGAVIALLIVLYLYNKRRKQRSYLFLMRESQSPDRGSHDSGEYKQAEIDYKELVIGEPLGQGINS